MRLAQSTAEAVARTAYGRLLSILAAGTRDIAAAEDALAEAFAAALSSWPVTGVPDRPEAWLLTAARNTAANGRRSQGVRDLAAMEVEQRLYGPEPGDNDFPDERLKLLFVCAHPAIDAGMRTPLMLQTVLGLDAVRIAQAFAVEPATMGQRLVRAKAKIRDAGIRFAVPDPGALSDRLADVLDAVYGAFGTGWDGPAEAGVEEDIAEEALYLGRLLVNLLPTEPEAKGLLALMLYCHARRTARFTPDGEFVPLADQDARLWNRTLIVEAEGLLTTASRAGRFGRYQCEAAIQSVHIQRPITGHTNHEAIALLYRMLTASSPTLGVLVAQAAALLEAGQPLDALLALDAIIAPRKETYQPYWVVRCLALIRSGQTETAVLARHRAMALTRDRRLLAHVARMV